MATVAPRVLFGQDCGSALHLLVLTLTETPRGVDDGVPITDEETEAQEVR